jgi:hypothetical protein
MGLDMYLYAKQFVSSSSWSEEKEKKKVKSIARLMKGTKFVEDEEGSLQFAQIKLQVAYWRKANQVHKYFVDKCAEGKDECQDTYVERKDLEDLLNRCEIVMKDHSRADELLPTSSGFFFGSTDYDEWYYSDLEETIPVLKKILKDAPKNWEFEYHASW